MEKNTNVGRRKSATVLVKVIPGNGKITINGKSVEDYMQNNPKIDYSLKSPLSLLELENNYDVIIKSSGGGLTGQAEAIKLGLARNLYRIIETNGQQKLKENGYLTRNSLCKERRKYGLKKARKASQFSKR
uniref:Small ribosomal subunit protein uS9c n=1 Tax=Monomorphina parapyrum TaxID=1664066 RepID=A0A0G3VG57_9EUGL|nr:ribosomal protein S9 [Monomorphina parapyrum]AKL78932.1 ribosomal protein S9 [Monomorphina parapyrum]